MSLPKDSNLLEGMGPYCHLIIFVTAHTNGIAFSQHRSSLGSSWKSLFWTENKLGKNIESVLKGSEWKSDIICISTLASPKAMLTLQRQASVSFEVFLFNSIGICDCTRASRLFAFSSKCYCHKGAPQWTVDRHFSKVQQYNCWTVLWTHSQRQHHGSSGWKW